MGHGTTTSTIFVKQVEEFAAAINEYGTPPLPPG